MTKRREALRAPTFVGAFFGTPRSTLSHAIGSSCRALVRAVGVASKKTGKFWDTLWTVKEKQKCELYEKFKREKKSNFNLHDLQTETEKLASLRTQILQLTLCSRHICHTQKNTHFTTSTPSLRNEEVSICVIWCHSCP